MEFVEVIFLMFSMILMTVVFLFLIRHSNQVLLSKIYDLEDKQKGMHKIIKQVSKNSSFNGVSLVKKVEALEKRIAGNAEASVSALKQKAIEAKA